MTKHEHEVVKHPPGGFCLKCGEDVPDPEVQVWVAHDTGMGERLLEGVFLSIDSFLAYVATITGRSPTIDYQSDRRIEVSHNNYSRYEAVRYLIKELK